MELHAVHWNRLLWNDPPYPSRGQTTSGSTYSVGSVKLEDAFYYCDSKGVEMRWPNGKRRLTVSDCARGLSGVMLVGDVRGRLRHGPQRPRNFGV